MRTRGEEEEVRGVCVVGGDDWVEKGNFGLDSALGMNRR